MKHYVTDGDGYFWNVPEKDLLALAGTVKVGETVKFLNGQKHVTGSVLAITDSLEKGKEEMQRLANLPKKKRKDDSFHGTAHKKSRKAAVKANDKIQSKPSGASITKEAQRKKKKIKAEVAKKKSVAADAMDLEDPIEKPETSIDNIVQSISDDSNASSPAAASDSSQSSVDASNLTSMVKRASATAVKDLKNFIQSDSLRSGSDEAGRGNQKSAKEDPSFDDSDLNGVSESKEKNGQEIDEESESHGKNADGEETFEETNEDGLLKVGANMKDGVESGGAMRVEKLEGGKVSKKTKSKKKNKKSKRVKRNLTVYPGQNYLYNDKTPGAVKLHERYNVMVLENELLESLKDAKSTTGFIRQMVSKIFTPEALENATPQGFPSRSKGKKHYKGKEVLPRLHPDGMKALLAKAVDTENDKKSWRPRASKLSMNNAFSCMVSSFKKHQSDTSSESPSDDSSDEGNEDGSGSE